MKRVYYLGYYDTDFHEKSKRRDVVFAATSKMDYISSVIQDLGYSLEIISAARSDRKLPKEVIKHDNKNIVYFSTFPGSNIFSKIVNKIQINQGITEALSKLDESDIVLCYHSLGYVNAVSRMHKKKKFKLILEVEEFYSDIANTKKSKKLELKALNEADAYICSSFSLLKILKPTKKPAIVCSGVYDVAPYLSNKRDDGFIHVVYAGNIDPVKGGAYAAIESARKLDKKYRMHILGPKEEDRLKVLNDSISQVNSISNGCIVSYDGFLLGDDFLAFLQSCHIGLCPQKQEGAFNRSSFPSKVLMYLSNGLKVVSSDLLAYKTSEILDAITICQTNDPQDIADAIKKCSEESYDSVLFMRNMNKSFRKQLSELFEYLLNDNNQRQTKRMERMP